MVGVGWIGGVKDGRRGDLRLGECFFPTSTVAFEPVVDSRRARVN